MKWFTTEPTIWKLWDRIEELEPEVDFVSANRGDATRLYGVCLLEVEVRSLKTKVLGTRLVLLECQVQLLSGRVAVEEAEARRLRSKAQLLPTLPNVDEVSSDIETDPAVDGIDGSGGEEQESEYEDEDEVDSDDEEELLNLSLDEVVLVDDGGHGDDEE